MSSPVLEPLLPCPFCGGGARWQECLGEFWVDCLADDCGGGPKMRSSLEAAIAAWNRRPAVPADQRPAGERSVGESADLSTARHMVHRAFKVATSRAGVAPFCCMPDGKHPCGVLCDELTATVEQALADRAARPPRDGDVHICDRRGCKGAADHRAAVPPRDVQGEDECVRCWSCKRCAGACDCTGGPVLDHECTCYELTGGHQPGCYFNRAAAPLPEKEPPR